MTNIVIPMAGSGTRFKEAGYTVPKPFIRTSDGKMMIEHTLLSLIEYYIDEDTIHLVCDKNHKEFINDDVVEQISQRLNKSIHNSPKFKLHYIDHDPNGALMSIMAIRDSLDQNEQLIIMNSDQYIELPKNVCDVFYEYPNTIVVFSDPTKNPKWSYAKINDLMEVVSVAEKNPISMWATAGIYTFDSAGMFFDYADQMIKDNDRTNGEFYICPIYNHIIKDGVYHVNGYFCTRMFGYGTPEDWKKYEDWYNTARRSI